MPEIYQQARYDTLKRKQLLEAVSRYGANSNVRVEHLGNYDCEIVGIVDLEDLAMIICEVIAENERG